MSRIVQHPAATIEEARAAALEWVARMRAIGHGLPSPVLLALALAPWEGGQ